MFIARGKPRNLPYPLDLPLHRIFHYKGYLMVDANHMFFLELSRHTTVCKSGVGSSVDTG